MSKTKLISLLALGTITLGLTGCEPTKVDQPAEKTEVIEIPTVEQEVIEEQQEVKEVEVKQEVKLDSPIIIKELGEDAIELKILGVRFTDDRNEFHDGVPVENVVVIKAEVKNITEDEEVSVWGDDLFNIYDTEGNKLDTYPNSDYEFSDYATLNPTRKAFIEIAYGIPTGTEFELEVVKDTWDGGIIGSLFFKGTEPQQEETQNPIERAEEIINKVGDTVKGETKETGEVKENGNEVIIKSPLTFEQYVNYFCDNTEQAFEEYFTLVFNSSVDGKTHKMITSDNVVLWSATNGESGASWLEGEDLQKLDTETFSKIMKAFNGLE